MLKHQVSWNEDGSCDVLARLAARVGASGDDTGVSGEGLYLEQANFTSITCNVYDINDLTSTIATPTITVSDAILEDSDIGTVGWTKDSIGYNFQVTLAATNFPTGNRIYRVEFTFNVVGGQKFHVVLEGQANAIASS
jgi:hypothetical protein